MIRAELRSENACRAILMCLELNSPMPLEEIYKMVGFCSNDPGHMLLLQSCVAKVLESLIIGSDTQLSSVLKALVSTGCSLLVQPV